MRAINRDGMGGRDKARGGGIAAAMATTSNAVSHVQTERELMRMSNSGH
jgi:hypothetical protein